MTETDADLLRVAGLRPVEVQAVQEVCKLRGIRASKFLTEAMLFYADYLLSNPYNITEPFTVDLSKYARAGIARVFSDPT